MKRQQRQPSPLEQDQERLYHAAEVLSAIAEPEALRVLRGLVAGPRSAGSIAARENLEHEEVERYFEQLGHAGLIHAHAKGWYQLTSWGHLVWRSIRPLVC